jgi:hypothetical protein
LKAGSGVYPLVELTKLRMSTNASVPPGKWDEYRVGAENDASLPVDYTLTGILIVPPRIGAMVITLRLTRNGIEVPGVYQSTEVTQSSDGGFTTLNSVYKIKFLATPDHLGQ